MKNQFEFPQVFDVGSGTSTIIYNTLETLRNDTGDEGGEAKNKKPCYCSSLFFMMLFFFLIGEVDSKTDQNLSLTSTN